MIINRDAELEKIMFSKLSQIDDFISNWKLLATQSKELRYYVYTTKTYNRLMNTYGEVCTDLEKPTLRSMRDVESAANMFYYTED